ncbi:MAG TPA: DNA-processing protein DprA, partial [Acidothermaceae bacterium]|nr:DNA-processing protein DprA [Acidothermaceae bacterium]
MSRDAGAAADRRARALLTRIAEPDRELSQHVLHDGAVSAVKGLRDGTLKVKNALHWQARVAGARPERDLEAGRACGARFIVPGDDEWPSALDELAYLDDEYGSVPYGLWVRGDLDLRAAFARSVAIVGARASTAYGEFVAAEFALGAAERGWTVVSG